MKDNLEYFVVGLVVLCGMGPVVGVLVLPFWRRRRAEMRAWREHQGAINKQRLGITPVDQIPAAWLRDRPRRRGRR